MKKKMDDDVGMTGASEISLLVMWQCISITIEYHLLNKFTSVKCMHALLFCTSVAGGGGGAIAPLNKCFFEFLSGHLEICRYM